MKLEIPGNSNFFVWSKGGGLVDAASSISDSCYIEEGCCVVESKLEDVVVANNSYIQHSRVWRSICSQSSIRFFGKVSDSFLYKSEVLSNCCTHLSTASATFKFKLLESYLENSRVACADYATVARSLVVDSVIDGSVKLSTVYDSYVSGSLDRCAAFAYKPDGVVLKKHEEIFRNPSIDRETMPDNIQQLLKEHMCFYSLFERIPNDDLMSSGGIIDSVVRAGKTISYKVQKHVAGLL